MQVIRDLNDIKEAYRNSVTALGNFDGIHIGHQEIIKTCINIAKEKNSKATIITFDPHPHQILRKQFHYRHITSLNDRLEYFERMGIDCTFLINFTEEFSQLTAEEFINQILIKNCAIKHVITGYNFYFGHNRSGDIKLLYKHAKQHEFEYQVIDKINYNYHDVSSSNIKRLIGMGAFGIVNKMLGRTYAIKGKVVKGLKRATSLGYPTINIALNDSLFLPCFGVYLTRVVYKDREYYGATNIGIKPTFDIDVPILETHLFEFDEDVYDKELSIEFLHFIRPERKFPSIEALISQIKTDIFSIKYALTHLFETTTHGH